MIKSIGIYLCPVSFASVSLEIDENTTILQTNYLNNYHRSGNIIADYRTQSILSRALHPGISFGNDRSPTPFRPMAAQGRHPPRQWQGSVEREGARHFVAGTPFVRSGCSLRSRTSGQSFGFGIYGTADAVMAYNQQYILAGQMHQAQVVIFLDTIRVLAYEIRAKT